jgi:hypothetical protein
MDQAMAMDEAMALEIADEETPVEAVQETRAISVKSESRAKIWVALVVAIVTTGLIVEAVLTVLRGRANGDMMIAVCPALGAIFLSIPAMRAWWVVIRELSSSGRSSC